MKERKSWHCDRCDAATEKTAFSTLNYQSRVIDLCPDCARCLDSFLDGLIANKGAHMLSYPPGVRGGSHPPLAPFVEGDL